MTETDLLWLFIQRVPKAIPGAHVERRNIIRNARVGKSESRVSNGIVGQADAFAILPGARHVECETKSAAGIVLESQKRWRANCARLGIPHLILRANEDEAPNETIARWVAELEQS